MINAVLVFNNNGQPRLVKFYSQIDLSQQQRLLQQIFSCVSTRPATACNFLPLPPLLAGGPNAWNTSDDQITLLYRHYATLYFIVISDSLESPLGLLDLIQVFVQALDMLFENVCELDLIFNFETLHATLEEMIVGGCVVETDLARIVTCVREGDKVLRRGRAAVVGSGGGGIGGGSAGGGTGGGGSTGGGGGAGGAVGVGLVALGRGSFTSGDLVWSGR